MASTTTMVNPEPDMYDQYSDCDPDDVAVYDDEPQDSSANIRSDLEAVLLGDFSFSGTFAFSQRFSLAEAPNPCIHVRDIGVVGMPLGERDARALITLGRPYSYLTNSKSSLTMSKTWELDPEWVTFHNPAWQKWVETTILPLVIIKLSTGGGEQLELHKIVIREADSEETDYNENQSSPRSFGSVHIVLPSLFSAGAAQFSHGGQEKSFNFSHKSLLRTTIIALYDGVSQKIGRLQSGFSLTLCYRLTHPTKNPLPALPNMDSVLEKLRNVIAEWNRASEHADVNEDGDEDDDEEEEERNPPRALACLLTGTYDTTNFSARSLLGTDKNVLDHLLILAKERQLNLRLVQISYNISGETSIPKAEHECYDSDDYDYWGHRGRNYCCEECDDEEEMESEEFALSELDIEDDEQVSLDLDSVFGLDGMPWKIHGLRLKEADVLGGSLSAGKCSYSLERDYPGGTLTKSYKRTAILVWPKAVFLTMSVGDVFQYACNGLQGSLSSEPTRKERKTVDALVEYCQSHNNDATRMKAAITLLRDTADRWNDSDLFQKAAKATAIGKHPEWMGVEGFISAYQAFEWETVKSLMEDAIKNGFDNTTRRTLLERLSTVAQEQQDAALIAWCGEQVDVLARSIRPVNAAQVQWLISFLRSKGISFFSEVIIPQLIAHPYNHSFWIALVASLNQVKLGAGEDSKLSVVVSQAVAHIAHASPALPTKETSQGSQYKNADVAPLAEIIKLCISTQNYDTCRLVLDRLKTAEEPASYSYGVSKISRSTYYAALVPLLDATLKAEPQVDLSLFSTFFNDALLQFLGVPSINEALVTICLQRSSLSDIKTLLTQARMDQLKLKSFTILMHKTLLPPSTNIPARKQFAKVVIECVNTVVGAFDFKNLHTRRTYSYAYAGYGSSSYQHGGTGAKDVIDLLKFVFQVGVGAHVTKDVLNRMNNAHPTTSKDFKVYLTDVLVPFIPLLGDFMSGRKVGLSAEPCGSFCAHVIKTFTRLVIANAPVITVPPSLLNIGCGCHYCSQLKAFFRNDNPSVSFSERQQSRTHIEQQLRSAGASAHGVTTDTRRYGSPHTLIVTKPATMTGAGAILANKQKGKKALESLGNTTIQQQILGVDYAWIQTAIVNAGNPTAANASLSRSNTSHLGSGHIANQAKRPSTGIAGPDAVKRVKKIA